MANFWDADQIVSKPTSNFWDADPIATPKPLGLGSTIKELGKQIIDVPEHLAGAAAAAYQGEDIPVGEDAKNSLSERLIKNSRDLSARRASEMSQEETGTAIPGVSTKDIQGFGQSLGFSGAGMAAGLAAAVPAGVAGSLATPVTGIAAGYTAGGVASGVTADRISKNQFLHDLKTKAEQDAGRELTAAEFAPIVEKNKAETAAYGKAEAIPEALGNVIDFAILRGKGGGFGKTIVARAFKKLASMYGTELATEMVTQQIQQRQESIAGLTDEQQRNYSSIIDWATSLKEVAASTILQTTLMAGAGGIASRGYDKLTTRKPQDVIKDKPAPSTTAPATPFDLTPSGAIQSEYVAQPSKEADQNQGALQFSPPAPNTTPKTVMALKLQEAMRKYQEAKAYELIQEQQSAQKQSESDKAWNLQLAQDQLDIAKQSVGNGAIGTAAQAGIDSGVIHPSQVLQPQGNINVQSTAEEAAQTIQSEAQSESTPKPTRLEYADWIASKSIPDSEDAQAQWRKEYQHGNQNDIAAGGLDTGRAGADNAVSEPAEDKNIGREWASEWGTQRITQRLKFNSGDLYEVQSPDGTMRRYSVDQIEGVVKRNEFSITPEGEVERKNKLAQFARAKEASDANKIANDKAVVEKNNIDGFGSELTPLQLGKVKATLDAQIRADNIQTTLRDTVRRLVAAGESLSIYQADVIKPKSNQQWNRMNQQEQDDYNRRKKEAGKKNVYEVGGYDLGKTAYDYAAYLIAKLSAESKQEDATQKRNVNTVASDNFALGQSNEEVKRMAQTGVVDMFGQSANPATEPEKPIKVTPQTISVNDIPKSLRITLEKVVDGKTKRKQVSAQKAVLAANQRITKLEALLKCL